MQLHIPIFPVDVAYPNTIINQARPAALYVEEIPPAERPGRQFRLQNMEEIKSHEKREKSKGLRDYGLYFLVFILLGVLLISLSAMIRAEGLAVGLTSTMILGAGFMIFWVLGVLFKKPQIYHYLLLQNKRLFYLNAKEAEVHSFGLDQVGKLEKRAIAGRNYLLFKLKTDPQRIVPGSPIFIWEQATENMFADALSADF